ncbi:MATE family efflux transporter [Selenomonas sp. KH1T6]|uniref:MATE family efflux transporter n=1 Tax=Selenomonas sp. KH1T6 TaxID=3158784 RepID=UPI0008A753FC|nr:Na+-driven multidrug efflux pump [Selenomonas ruminantium]
MGDSTTKNNWLPGRSYWILLKKFHIYLFPAMLAIVALTVNEFVDGMLVANLIGSHAMAVVSLGYPILFIIATLYTLIGTGGGTLYALFLGEHKAEEAAKVCYLSLWASFLSGLLLMFIGLAFADAIMPLLCPDEELMAAGFPAYYRALVITAPVMTSVLTLFGFLSTAGAPALATCIHVAANAVNLIMDYVYIARFGMDVSGAAWATITGYLVGFAILIVPLWLGRTPLKVQKAGRADLPLLWEALSRGGAAAMSQLGMSLKFAACNVLAIKYGGAEGAVAFSLCVQVSSFGSIFYAGPLGAANPLLSMLQGQGDLSGRHRLLKISLLYGIVLAAPFTLWVMLAPAGVAEIYQVTAAEELALSMSALPIVALAFLPRAFYIIFMYYLQILGRKSYAMFISIFDGFGGTVPLALLCCYVGGLTGLWWTFPLNSLLLLLIVLGKNRLTALSSQGVYEGFLLKEKSDACETLDFTMTSEPEVISQVSEEVYRRLKRAGLPENKANIAGLAVEEMAVYTSQYQKQGQPLDVLLRLYENRVEIDYRSLGESGNPTEYSEKDNLVNLCLLQKLASQITYDYIMGMNSTHIVLDTKRS